VVGGRGGIERGAWTEPGGDRAGVGDDARGEHGACDVHGTGSGGAHGMRGDAVGVGDVAEVPGDARSAGDAAGDDDGGRAGRERDAGVVGGRGGIERGAWTEPGGDRAGVGDDARGEHGACDVHGTGSGGAHGMRGDAVGVGDVAEVPGDARSAGDAAGDDDGGRAGRERDAGVVGGRGGIERGAWTEPGGDRAGVGDDARGEHGACDVHGTGSGGAHGMRGDAVGVGDIAEVPGDARSAGDAAGDDDGGRAGRERDAGVVGGRGGIERGAWTEPGGDRAGVGDDARGEHGACDVHGTGSGGAHGMRGDAVGVGDIAEVPGDARSAGDAAGDDDGGRAGRERDAGVVGGRGGIERGAWTEPGGDRAGVGDDARGEHGACDVHGTGSGGAHGMRGDAVGVGDIAEVPGDARSAGDAAGDDDGGRPRRELDSIDVVRCFRCKCIFPVQHCRGRLVLCDGAWGSTGVFSADEDDAVRRDGMRADEVGLGDVGAVPVWTRVSGHSLGDDDSRGPEFEHDEGLVR
jgi:hypothetical protein